MNYHDIITLIKEFERQDRQIGGQYTDYTKLQRFNNYLEKQRHVFEELQLILKKLDVETIDSESATIDVQDVKRLDTVVRYYFKFERHTAATTA